MRRINLSIFSEIFAKIDVHRCNNADELFYGVVNS